MTGAVLARRESPLHGARAQRRTADAQHQHMLVGLEARDQRRHFHFQLGAVGHGQKRQLTRCRFTGQTLRKLRAPGLAARRIAFGQTGRIRSGPLKTMRHDAPPAF